MNFIRVFHRFYNHLIPKIGICLLFSQSSFSAPLKTILFDVFGTCVEIRNSLVQQGQIWSETHPLQVNWEPLVEAWIEHHKQTVELIKTGKLPFITIDEIHRKGIEELLPKFVVSQDSISENSMSQMVDFWHHLRPWRDVAPGLNKLHSRFKLGTLSNANRTLLNDLANFGKLPWDIFFSGDKIQKYKPDPRVYEYAEKNLGSLPSEILLVASHEYDLRAAMKRGWKTALVIRPEESLRGESQQIKNLGEFDYITYSFTELAEQLVGNRN